jgi:hypothetical protein
MAANSIKIYIDVNKQPGTSIKMFYKTAQSESDVLQSDWVLVDPDVEALETDSDTFTEQQYEVNDLGEFTHYMVKIVNLSDSSVYVPQSKNLRVIALGT